MRDTRGTAAMRRTMAGVHQSDDLRAERVDGRWRTESKMRDVGALASPPTPIHLYEYHPAGQWTPIGTFRTLRLAEVARDMLKAGTHFVQGAHSAGCGDVLVPIPARLIPSAEAVNIMAARGLVEA